MIKANEIKKGMVLKIDDKPCEVIDYQHVKLGKGGAVLQTKFKDLRDGGTLNKRIRSEETLEQMFVDKQKFEYLYSSGDTHFFMHKETYEQIELTSDEFCEGEGTKWCKENTDVEIHFLDNKPFTVVLPNTVDLRIKDTPPALKGATITNQYKKALLETGAELLVPPFCEPGELIRCDTRTREYVERVKG